jgi:hypothetical protein
MQRGWREFQTGWRDARWSFDTLIVLAPIALLVALIVQINQGKVPPHVVSWFYAGIGGFLGGMVVGLLWIRYWKRLQTYLRQIRTGARQLEPGQRLVGVRGGEVREGAPRPRDRNAT